VSEPVQETMTRRTFLGWLATALASLWALFLALPAIGLLIQQPAAAAAEDFISVGPVDALKPDEPVAMTFPDETTDAYVHETVVRSVWVVKGSDGQIVAYSPICPHLGCRYSWDPAANRFVCPCHNSVFDVEGKLLSGPAPRNLDSLPSKVEGGVLMVKWERFELATPEKIPV